MATKQKTWNINEICTANRAAGYHWFDSDTMRSFGCKVFGRVYQGSGGVYFVTQDSYAFDDDRKVYIVRVFNPATGNVDTVGEIATDHYATLVAAYQAAAEAAGEGYHITEAQFVAPTAADDLLLAINAEGAGFEMSQVAELVRLAKRHHRGAERECNEGGDHTTAAEKKIVALLAGSGISAIFSGDPRGCTVRLKMPSGRTNDFANTGWCIATN